MNLLELLGIVFLAIVIINAFVGIWAVKTAGNEEEYTVSYSSGK
jgi:heme A synthase